MTQRFQQLFQRAYQLLLLLLLHAVLAYGHKLDQKVFTADILYL